MRPRLSLARIAHRWRRLAPLVAVLWLAGWLVATLGAWGQAVAANTQHDHIAPHTHQSARLAQEPHDHLKVTHHHVGYHQHGHASPAHPEHDHQGYDQAQTVTQDLTLGDPATMANAEGPALPWTGSGGTDRVPKATIPMGPSSDPGSSPPAIQGLPTSSPLYLLTERIRL